MSRSYFRKPSPMKSFKARTTGRTKRAIKRSVNPVYGKKGMGFITNPKKSAYNYVYKRTSYGISDFNKSSSKPKENNGNDTGCAVGCLGFLGLWFLLGLLISQPKIGISIILICFLVWFVHKSEKGAKRREQEKKSLSEFQQKHFEHKSDNETNSSNDNAHNVDPEIISYLNQKPEIIEQNGKEINKNTGYKTAKQSSIAASEYDLREVINWGRKDDFYSADDYFTSIYLPYYYAGILAYKRGNWDKAEAWWLSVLNLKPEVVSQKLAILYRKQHRYKDVVDMYILALKYANNSLLNMRKDYYERLVNDKDKAGELLLKHLNNDKSLGLKSYPNRADMEFAEKLSK